MEEREISLVKGRQISLTKGLKQLKVEVVWEENKRSVSSDEDFDIDLIIVELDERGRALSPDHLVFYGSLEQTEDYKFTDPERSVVHSGDDRDGSGDGEECIIYPGKLNSRVKDIVFLINIYDSTSRKQTFKMIKGAEVRAYEDGKDIAKLVYRLDEDYKDDTILVFGKMTRIEGNKLTFTALGEGSNQTLFKSLVKYGLKFKESDI